MKKVLYENNVETVTRLKSELEQVKKERDCYRYALLKIKEIIKWIDK
jgi:hypothetical protein